MAEPVDLEGLRRIAAEHDDVAERVVLRAVAELERSRRQITAIRALHREFIRPNGTGPGGVCEHCDESWPCTTIRAVGGTSE